MSEPVVIAVPQMNPNDEHAVLVRWHVESGSRVAAGDALATLETTKATFDVNAPSAGFVFFDIEPNTMILVGSTLAVLSDNATPPAVLARSDGVAAADGLAQTSIGGSEVPAGEQRFTRKALRLMKQYGLTPADFHGAVRVDTAEVERVAQVHAGSSIEQTAQSRANTSATHSGTADDTAALESLPQSPAKLIEAHTLAQVYREVVPSTVSISLSSERVDAHLRELAKRSGPVSLLELAIYHCARILADFPELNGFHAEGRAWRYREVAIGFAINLGKSLRVPVVRRTAELSQLDIARAVRDLSLRYMRDELILDDLTGGTFTITDLSSSGVVQFIPVLNHRQAAILGICAERPGTGHRDLVLTFDHRMADGVRAAQFLGELRDQVEQPPG